MLNHTFFACLLGMSLVSCSHAQQQKTKEFRLPDVPVTLTAPEDRAAYLSLHYWDHFDFADTSPISRPEITEQQAQEYLGCPHGENPPSLETEICSKYIPQAMFSPHLF